MKKLSPLWQKLLPFWHSLRISFQYILLISFIWASLISKSMLAVFLITQEFYNSGYKIWKHVESVTDPINCNNLPLLPTYTIFLNMTLKFVSSKDGIHFFNPWIWLGLSIVLAIRILQKCCASSESRNREAVHTSTLSLKNLLPRLASFVIRYGSPVNPISPDDSKQSSEWKWGHLRPTSPAIAWQLTINEWLSLAETRST